MLSEPATDAANEALEFVTDVSAQRVAHVYAEALLNAAQKQGQAAAVGEELTSMVQDVFKQLPHLETFLSSNAISRTVKEATIHKAFQGRASELLFNFLLVLNRHERLMLLRPIQVAYWDAYNAREKRIHVQVRSAVPLQDDQRSRLIDSIRASLELEPILDEKVAPELIGGLIVRVGDDLFDFSVRSQLVTLRNQLIERSSHEIQSGRDRFSSPS